MPIIDFTQPDVTLIALLLFVLCTALAANQKRNTVTAIMLLAFLTLLVGHIVELNFAEAEQVTTLIKNLAIDEVFIFISFLSFLWTDRMQVEHQAKLKRKGKSKGKDEKWEDKAVDDGLDVLWKKV